MDDIEAVKVRVDSYCRLAMSISVEDATRLVNEVERTDILMPFVDPTRYMEIRDKLGDHARAARAFLEFRRELAKIVAGIV